MARGIRVHTARDGSRTYEARVHRNGQRYAATFNAEHEALACGELLDAADNAEHAEAVSRIAFRLARGYA